MRIQATRMADTLVAATISVLFEKVISIVDGTERIALEFGFFDDLMELREYVVMLQAVLADAGRGRRNSNAVQLWLERLEEVAFDADHGLDKLHYETLRRKVESRNKHVKRNKVSFFLSFFYNYDFRRRMAAEIRNIVEKLKEITREANGIGLRQLDTFHSIYQLTDSIGPPNTVGRAHDERRIVEVLLTPSEEVVSVIPIVGMAGLGKTTLAKLIYNNPQIDLYFDKKIWVSASRCESFGHLLQLILESLRGRRVEMSNRDDILLEIREVLEGKRYLLVLDNVWDYELELWGSFFTILEGLNYAAKGSWCLVTTRLEQVAYAVTRHLRVTVRPYELGKLTDNECWSIIKGKVVAEEETPQALKAFREELIEACSGLPLAASLLGGMLRIRPKPEWPSIIERCYFSWREDENIIEQILMLSFDNLPSWFIKKCFVYCSKLYKDTEIERDLLIELWMAEGFLQPDLRSESTMEDIGKQHIRFLLQSSLLEEVKDSPKTCYKMQDIAGYILKPDSTELENGAIDNRNRVRYLVLNSVEGMAENVIQNLSTSVRTLFVERAIPGDILLKFQYLHVLKLSGAVVKELPSSIGKLIHLRFLDLSDSGIRTLTESLCKLYHLQTLRTDGCMDLTGLPERTSNLISLRHLHFYKDNDEFQMPLEMGQLTCLQTLEFFNVGEEKGRQIEELGSLNDLKGKLVIRNLHLVNGKEGAERANISAKPNLLKLELIWGSNREAVDLDGEVLEGLRLHPNLKELVITNFKGDKFPEWFMNLSKLKFMWGSRSKEGANCDGDLLNGLRPHANLQELVITNYTGDQFSQWFMNLTKVLDKLMDLRIINCQKLEEFPMLGELPFLQYLELKGLTNVTYIGPSFYGADVSDNRNGTGQTTRRLFPALKTLKLDSMPKLEGWMEVRPTTEVFPYLENLAIQYCPRLTSIPSHFPVIKELKILTPLIVKNSMPLAAICSRVTSLVELCIHSVLEITCFPGHLVSANRNLEILRISSCSNLERVVPSFQVSCTSLRELFIHGCEKLVELPQGLDNLSRLEILSVEECPNLGSFPNEQLKFLRHLKIAYCDSLSNLPHGMIKLATYLSSIRISHCPNLSSLPLHLDNKTLLSSLWISNCPKWTSVLKELKDVYLSCLRELRIGCFSDLVQFDSFRECILNFRELHTVGLYGHPKWTELPDELQHLRALRLLFVSDFGIEALPDWLGILSSLKELGLYKCKKLKNMPSDKAMKRLTNLTRLSIFSCPLVKKRCIQHYGPGSGWSKPKFELNTD